MLLSLRYDAMLFSAAAMLMHLMPAADDIDDIDMLSCC